MGQSGDLLARFSDALDRNTKVLDLVVNHVIHGRPGAAMPPMPSSTVEDTDDETTPTKTIKKFRGRAQPMSHKNDDELRLRVSLLSKK
jgi:hypothetical protein